MNNSPSNFLWHPFTPVPHYGPKASIVRATGAYLFDDTGKKYFDATSSWWCNTHGHCHPRLVQALTLQAQSLDQMLFAPHTHPVACELAETLIARLGPPFSRVFYSDDGSTAVEAALKMSLQFWRLRGEKRTRFVSLKGAYHGDTLGAVSVGSVNLYHDLFGCLLDRTACVISDPKSIKASLDKSVAALIIEPLVLGASGMVIYPKEYLENAVQLAKDAGTLVIFDEVFTGFGRTGTLFAMEQVASRPDIVCLSKGLTAGMLPLAVTVATEEIYREFCGDPSRTFYHGHTFSANALGCAVALESLKMFSQGVLEKNKDLALIFAKNIARFRVLSGVVDVRHLGMIWAVEFNEGTTTTTLWQKASRLWEKGIWIRPLHRVVYVVPPYCTTPSELQWVMDELYDVMK